jgi:hypothetical protein
MDYFAGHVATNSISTSQEYSAGMGLSTLVEVENK